MRACSLALRRHLLRSSASPIPPKASLIQNTHVFRLLLSRGQVQGVFGRLSSTYPSSPIREPRKAAASFWTVTFTLLAICGGTWLQHKYFDTTEKDTSALGSVYQGPPQSQSQHDPFLGVIDTLKMLPVEIPPGHVGNLTAEQEAKLRELWIMTLKIFGVNLGALEEEFGKPVTRETSPEEKKKPKRRFGLFGSKEEGESTKDNGKDTDSQNALAVTIAAMHIGDGDDKYGLSKQFQRALAEMTPEEIRTTFWNMVKHNTPDGLLLRFLRARKWDVKKALIMFISTIHWRLIEAHVDDDVMMTGEGLAYEQSQSSDPKEKKAGEEFLFQLREGKSFFHGCDMFGRPICVIRVRKHKAGDQSIPVMERYTVYTIESARMMLADPVEAATIVFDMSDFSMANMDYAPVKFMIKCFEANYPECLGAVLIHKAPWIFSGIWNIIKGWLDPVVASKIHFTRSNEDIEQFIPRDRIPKELNGDEDWEYKYIEPDPAENKTMEDTATRDALITQRQELAKELQDATISWISAGIRNDKDAKVAAEEIRNGLIDKLRKQYWELDPYIRARSIYDRFGVIQGGGKINFYPGSEEMTKEANGVALSEQAATSTNVESEKTPREEVPTTNGTSSTTSAAA